MAPEPTVDLLAAARILVQLDRAWRRPCGFIYRIGPRGGEPAVCKLGFSADPDVRLRQLQTGCPFDLAIASTFPGSPEAEAVLHAALHQLRVRGEWFRIGPELEAAVWALSLIGEGLAVATVRPPASADRREQLDLFERARSAGEPWDSDAVRASWRRAAHPRRSCRVDGASR